MLKETYDSPADDMASETSFDSSGKQKSFRRLITRFAEKTSMQGPPYINMAKLWWAKVIWAFLLLCAVAAMVLHLWYLFSQWYSWPKTTIVSLGFDELPFPQVTVCNTNVLHRNRFNRYEGAKELKMLVDDLRPENFVPHQFDDNYDPHSRNQNKQDGNKQGDQQGGTGQGGNQQDGTDQGGNQEGGADQGGSQQGGADQGGNQQDGTGQGGNQQGGTDQGGKQEGEADQGGNQQDGTGQGGNQLDENQQGETDHDGNQQSGTGQGGNQQGGTDQGGNQQGGTDQGGNQQDGTGQGGNQQEGADQGGNQQDGTDQGGNQQGGTDQDGNQQDGVGQGGTQQGGTGQGGNQQGGTGQGGNQQGVTQQNGNQQGGNQPGDTQASKPANSATQSPNNGVVQQDGTLSTTGTTETSRSRSSRRTSQSKLPTRRTQTGNGQSTPQPASRKKRFANNYKNVNVSKYRENYQDFDEDVHGLDSPIDSQTRVENVFRELYMDIDKSTRSYMGHHINDMLVGCTFNGRQCDSSFFNLHQTAEYGNCWTISSEKFIVGRAGPGGGLTLVLFLETPEYLKGLTTGYGARIQFQERDTYPFPFDEGVFISGAMETDIGLKLRTINRLGGNYGSCNDGVDFMKLYNRTYTRRACQAFCRITTVIKTCKCFDDNWEEFAFKKDDTLRPCRSADEQKCKRDVLGQYRSGELTCTCENPCREVDYVKSVSARQWPTNEYAVNITRLGGDYGNCNDGKEFKALYNMTYSRRACQSFCQMSTVFKECSCFDDDWEEFAFTENKNLKPCRSKTESRCLLNIEKQFHQGNLTCTCENPCSEHSFTKSISQRQWPTNSHARVLLEWVCDRDIDTCETLRNDLNELWAVNNNFLKLNIYFEDLNFENITETPDIEIQQFLSDVGGAVGLWIGLSILSLCELIQLVCELCYYGAHKVNKAEVKDKNKRDNKRSNEPSDKTLQDIDTNKENRWPHTVFSAGERPHQTRRPFSDRGEEYYFGNARRNGERYHDDIRYDPYSPRDHYDDIRDRDVDYRDAYRYDRSRSNH